MNMLCVAERAKDRARALFKSIVLSMLVLTSSAAGAAAQSRFTDTVTGSCVFAFGTAHCVRQYRYNDPGNSGIKHYGEPAEEVAEARERDRAWEARCRPILRQDAYGVSRYLYAAPGCEFGRLN
ncbi:MAG: hypothetical protein ABWY35_04815 [Pseudorhodoplanes sp.]